MFPPFVVSSYLCGHIVVADLAVCVALPPPCDAGGFEPTGRTPGCNREETYERDVKEYKASQPQQLELDLFATPEPTEAEIFQAQVDDLKNDIWQKYQGKTASRMEIVLAMLPKWFGRRKGKHYTEAFKQMQADGRIVSVSGALSADDTKITFRP